MRVCVRGPEPRAPHPLLSVCLPSWSAHSLSYARQGGCLQAVAGTIPARRRPSPREDTHRSRGARTRCCSGGTTCKPLQHHLAGRGRARVFQGGASTQWASPCSGKSVASRGAVGVAPLACPRHRRRPDGLPRVMLRWLAKACVPVSLLIRATSRASFAASPAEPHRVRPAVARWRRRANYSSAVVVATAPQRGWMGACGAGGRVAEKGARRMGACRGSLAPRDSKPWTTGRCVSVLLRVLCVSLETRCVRHACALGGGLPSCLPDRILTESRTDAVVFKGLGGTQGAETGGRGHR